MKGALVIGVVLAVLFLVSPISMLGAVTAKAQSYATYYGPALNGTLVGSLPSNAIVSISVLIPPRNLNELMLIAQEVAEHQAKPLTRSEVLSEFAPSQAELDAIESYLKEEGFVITYVSPDRLSIMAQAPASTVESVFKTTLGVYKSPGGLIYYAPESTPSIPEQLSGTLILGLTNRTAFRPQYIIAGQIKHYAFVPVNNSAIPEQVASAYTYYTPADFEGAYNVSELMPYSANASIAIIDAYGDPLIYEDVQEFDSSFNLPPANLTVIPIGPYHPSLGIFTGWDVETALDVEAAQSMAPYAHIYLVVASNNGNALFEAIDYVVSTDLADVVSMSWGAPENLFGMSGVYTTQPAYILNYPYADYYFALGTAEGISFFASSGDEGAYDATPTSYGAVLFPSSSPFVTAVGGTSLYVNITSGSLEFLNSTGTYGYETAWSVSPLYGTSEVASTGGYSSFFPKPWYQYGVVSGDYRTTPDVAADANPYTGFVEIVTGEEIVIGGTSLASPLWAGITADIDGYLGMRLGLLNPLLYAIYKNGTLYDMAFHQITFGYNGKYLAHPGYNLVTGLGSPNAGLLAEAIKYMLTYYPSLSIAVTTYEPNTEYSWYMYNSTFQVVAAIYFPNGTPVTSGSFKAYVFTVNGLYEAVPLSYNGTYWVGSVYVAEGQPPNVWSIVVNGTAGGYSGTGATDAYIGTGITIIEPVPYPYAPAIPVDQPFEIEVYAIYPNGTPLTVPSLTVAFYHKGVDYFNATLLPVNVASEPGLYAGYAMLPYPDPQGAYIMYVYSEAPNGKLDGDAYTYVYFGEEIIYGYVITPLNDGTPSVTAGQTLYFVAMVENPWGLGMFTSQVYANIYSLNGTLVAQVPLYPASAPMLGYQVGSFTVPTSMAPGWYNVVFVSEENTSNGPLYGYFNQSFYVAPESVSATIYMASYSIEGVWLNVYVSITYPNGTPVTSGTFTATFVPQQLANELMLLGFFVGEPLQYNSAIGLWTAEIYVPSVYNTEIYSGEGVYSLAGPYILAVSGETQGADNLYPATQSVYVSPITSATAASDPALSYMVSGSAEAVGSLTYNARSAVSYIEHDLGTAALPETGQTAPSTLASYPEVTPVSAGAPTAYSSTAAEALLVAAIALSIALISLVLSYIRR